MSVNYPKYDKYKATGLEWLPQLPTGWGIKRFKYHAKVCNGKDQKAVLVEDGIYSIFGSGGEFGRSNEYLYNKPSVLLGRKGTIDRPLFVDQPFWTVDTMFYTQISHSTDPRFFYYSCLCIAFDKYQMGSAIPSMTQEDLSCIEFSSPPLPEQKAIAAFLDEKTGKIDALLEKLKRQKELLTEKRTAIITRAVTKGLNPDAHMKETGIKWLPQVPEHWEIKRLKYWCNNLVDKSNKDGTFPIIELEHVLSCDGKLLVNKQDLPVIESNTDKLFFKEGYVLYSKLRPYLRKAIFADFDGYCSPEFFVIQTEQNSQFIFYLCLSDIFNSLANSSAYGVKMPRTSWDIIGNLPFAFPPLQEQKAIAEYIEKQTAKIDLLQSKTDKQIELLKEYRTSLITSAVTGQIKVTDNQQQRLSA